MLKDKRFSQYMLKVLRLEYEPFLSAAVFLAATHDMGKATSCFQSVITGACTDKYAEIEDSGFPLERFHFGEAVFERGYRVYPSKGGRRNHKKYQRQGYKVT